MRSFLPAVFALPLIAVILLEGVSCQASKMKIVSSEKMDSVPAGAWGGEHVNMQVTDAGADLEFDCAHGRIDGRMNVDGKGAFDLKGTYTQEHGGPSRDDEETANQPARYTGQTDGKTMTLTITLTGTKQNAGSFTLTYNTQSILKKCR